MKVVGILFTLFSSSKCNLGDKISENSVPYGTSTGYHHSPNYKSEIYLKKGEQAYYYIYDRDGAHYLNYQNNCQTLDTTHSCTWLEIRKTGD